MTTPNRLRIALLMLTVAVMAATCTMQPAQAQNATPASAAPRRPP